MAKTWQISRSSIQNASKSNLRTTQNVTFGLIIQLKEPIVVAAFTLITGMFLGALFMSLLVISRSDD